MRAGQRGPGKNIERPPAFATVVKNRRAIAAMDQESAALD
jgi:hypothetical protein